MTVRVGAYTLAALAPDGTVVAEHRRRFGTRRTDRVDPRTQLTQLARNPGAWRHSAVREQAPDALRTPLDVYARAELRAVLQTWATLQGQYGADVALRALTEAVQRGRAVVADATVLAVRLATWGPDRPADPGPALHVYDDAPLPHGGGHVSPARRTPRPPPTGRRGLPAAVPQSTGGRAL